LRLLDLKIVLFEPFVSIAGIIVIDHSPDLGRIVPKIAEPPRVVVGFSVVFVRLVAEPGGKQGEKFSDILGVGVDKGERGNNAKLHQKDGTANPAAGKAMRLLLSCSLVTVYVNLSF
jgi:hypothetical protein